jgi:hypothetical protein
VISWWPMLRALAVFCVAGHLFLAESASPPKVEWIRVEPSSIFVDQLPVSVRVTAKGTSLSQSAERPKVFRYAKSTGTPEALAELHDDGQNGDATAGDGVFTAVFKLEGTTPVAWRLGILAPGQNGLTQSGPAVTVRSRAGCREAVTVLADLLKKSDLAAASEQFLRSLSQTAVQSLKDGQRAALESSLRSGRVTEENNGLCRFTAAPAAPDDSESAITLVQDVLGRWLVAEW